MVKYELNLGNITEVWSTVLRYFDCHKLMNCHGGLSSKILGVLIHEICECLEHVNC